MQRLYFWGVPKVSKKSLSMSLGLLWGLPKAPFPKSLGVCTPSHTDAQVAGLRRP